MSWFDVAATDVARSALTTETADESVQAERLLGPDAPDGVGQLLWLSERGGGYTVADTETGLVRWRADLAQPLVGRVVPDVAGCIVAGRRPGTPVPPRPQWTGHRAGRLARRIRGALPLAPAQILILTKGTLLAIDATNSALPTMSRRGAVQDRHQ